MFCRADGLDNVTRYDETNGMLQWHITQMQQDRDGFMWFATWNGLNRFDGYEIVNFKSRALESDRIRNISLNDRGNLWCKVEDDVYEFNLKTYQFVKVPESERETVIKIVETSSDSYYVNSDTNIRELVDHQGIHWQFYKNSFSRINPTGQRGELIPQPKPSQIKVLYKDKKNRYWITTKEDATVRLYSADNKLIGYMNQQGKIQSSPVSLKWAVYSIFQLKDGTFFMGTKPGSLMRLKETSPNNFTLLETTDIDCNGVYDIKQDANGRLWLATFNDGIKFIEKPEASKLVIKSVESTYKKKFRQLMFIGNSLLVTSTHGLLVGNMNTPNLTKMKLKTHIADKNRESSLDCNALMNILKDSKGRIFITTESGGINQLVSKNLLADKLEFKHYNTTNGFPSDIAFVMCEINKHLYIVSNSSIIELLPDSKQQKFISYDRFFWRKDLLFTEAEPIVLPDGRLAFGTEEGALAIKLSELRKSNYVPKIVITGLSVNNSHINRRVNGLDTIVLKPNERNLTVYYAALDLRASEEIQYSTLLKRSGFLARNSNADFGNATKNRYINLMDLRPGEYQLRIRATNSDGIWNPKCERVVTIIVKPTFWETPWATALYIFCGALFIFLVVYNHFYIRNIKEKQKETLQSYLSMLETKNNTPHQGVKLNQSSEAGGNSVSSTGGNFVSNGLQVTESQLGTEVVENTPPAMVDDVPKPAQISAEDDLFMKRLIKYVNAHIGDTDVNMVDMADAVAISRSGLNRKLKDLMGISPSDFMREARMKAACKMLKETDDSISDIAFACGFSDAKYFSKCFRSNIGISPTDYRLSNN